MNKKKTRKVQASPAPRRKSNKASRATKDAAPLGNDNATPLQSGAASNSGEATSSHDCSPERSRAQKSAHLPPGVTLLLRSDNYSILQHNRTGAEATLFLGGPSVASRRPNRSPDDMHLERSLREKAEKASAMLLLDRVRDIA